MRRRRDQPAQGRLNYRWPALIHDIDYDGKFFVGGLVSRSIVRRSIGRDSGLFVEERRMLGELRERIRDIRLGPDGFLYFLTDAEDGQLWRLRPAVI